MSNNVASNSLKSAYENQRYEERQVNFICEAFRVTAENHCNNDMVPLVIYLSDHKVPNGGMEDIIEIHGLFDESTVQTAIFRLNSDLEKWCLEQPLPNNSNQPHVLTELVKTETGDISAIRFIKRKIYPFWSPHNRRFS